MRITQGLLLFKLVMRYKIHRGDIIYTARMYQMRLFKLNQRYVIKESPASTR